VRFIRNDAGPSAYGARFCAFVTRPQIALLYSAPPIIMSADDQPSSLLEEEDPLAESECATGEHLSGAAPYRELIAALPHGVLILSREHTLLYANPAACLLFKKPLSQLESASLTDLLHPDDYPVIIEKLQGLDVDPSETVQLTLRFEQGATAWCWLECTARSLPLEQPGSTVLVLRDFSNHQEELERLTHLAFTDPVTNLANRAFLSQRLEHRLKLRDLHSRPIGIISIDLDGFKRVNDTFGHAVGDELLRQFGARLRKTVRDADTVARMGGDEFVLLLEEVSQLKEVSACAQRLLGELWSPFLVNGREIAITGSMGLTLGSSTQFSAEELLRQADTALYRAKALGKARYVVFDEPARAQDQERLDRETELRQAVKSREFKLRYQPEVELQTGKISSIEPLLHWDHPRRGAMNSADLSTSIQEASLGREISRWLHDEVCRQAKQWSRIGAVNSRVQVVLSLSAEDLRCEELPAELASSLTQADLPPHCLLIACPESVLMEDVELAKRRARAFRNLGVGLAIDNFGARFGSLRFLESLPIQVLRVDPTLVEDAENGGALLRAICSIARDLQIRVCARCVGTPEQRDALLRANCDFGQGSLLAPPLTESEMSRQLREPGRVIATSDATFPSGSQSGGETGHVLRGHSRG